MSQADPHVPAAVFTGRFGSGKTEAAIAYALSRVPPPVTLVDLDVVTPYFRSREAALALAEHGVQVIAPAAAGLHLDTPAIRPEILGAIERSDGATVLDVGGDRQGARALGLYSAALELRGYEMHFVVNPFRPFTNSLDGLSRSIAEIEASSRLKVTSLVCNPNLMGETTPELISSGLAQIDRQARELGLPIALVCVERRWAESLMQEQLQTPLLVLDRWMLHPWEEPAG